MDTGNPDAKLSHSERPPSDWALTERISWFPVPGEEELDPRVAELVERQREKLGAPNNVGFSLDDVYDIIIIITTASIYNYNNRVAEAAGHIPDRKNHGLFR